MNLHYIAVYKIRGFSKMPTGQETVTLSDGPDFTLRLTSDPEPYCVHSDKISAIGYGMLTAMFGGGDDDIYKDRLSDKIKSNQDARREQHGAGVFFVFEGRSKIDDPKIDSCRKMADFSFCFDAYDKKSVSDRYKAIVRQGLAATTLFLLNQSDDGVSKVGECSYLIEPDSGRPIYSFTFTGGAANLYLSTSIDSDALLRVQNILKKPLQSGKLPKVIDLLTESQEIKGDELREYVAAWSALEIFVTSTFAETYGEQWSVMMRSNAPSQAKAYFDHLDEIMKGRLRLTDRFLIISSLLNPDDVNADMASFAALKEARDKLFHGNVVGSNAYPSGATRSLLKKYLALHIDRMR